MTPESHTDPLDAMSCQQFVEIVTDYLEQQLDEARRLWTDEHLAECDACRATSSRCARRSPRCGTWRTTTWTPSGGASDPCRDADGPARRPLSGVRRRVDTQIRVCGSGEDLGRGRPRRRRLRELPARGARAARRAGRRRRRPRRRRRARLRSVATRPRRAPNRAPLPRRPGRATAAASSSTARAASDREVLVPPGTSAEAADGSAYDLTEPGQRAVVARVARAATATSASRRSTRQAPRFAERGLPGEEGWIELRLRLLADAGLVGLPNAGKSSLLARAHAGPAQGGRLSVHDHRPGAGHDRRRRAAARPRRHPRADRGGRRGRGPGARVPRPRRAVPGAGAPGGDRPAGRGRPGGRLRDGACRAGGARRPAWTDASRAGRAFEGGPRAGGARRRARRAVSRAGRRRAGGRAGGLVGDRRRDRRPGPLRCFRIAGGSARPGSGAHGRRLRGRAHDLPPGGRAGLRRGARGRRVPRAAVAGSSCSWPVTTSRTSRRSRTWSRGCARSAWSRRSSVPASSRATRCGSATRSSSSIPVRPTGVPRLLPR